MIPGAQAILDCDEAAAFERRYFGGDEEREWDAMLRAGRGVAAGIVEDFGEIGGFPRAARILVVAGKGHNGGDALLAAEALLEQFPDASAEVFLVFGGRAQRPLAARAHRRLVHAGGARVRTIRNLPGEGARDLLIDGVFGFQFRPPVEAATAAAFDRLDALEVRMRAAVDLPSGLGGNRVLRADFTYGTGIVKAPVVDERHAGVVGRLRFIDLGFPVGSVSAAEGAGRPRVLTAKVLDALRGFREPGSDKRSFGHVMVVAGSRTYPGAALMAVLAALRSGAGLVTALVPESLVAAFAARAPAAMWVGCPETPAGGLALEGLGLWRERAGRAGALVVGPGLGREPETLALAREIIAGSQVPVVVDADALQPEIVSAGAAPRILTPHAGESERIFGRDAGPNAGPTRTVVVRKGRLTRIEDGSDRYVSLSGGPVLARGGSGDLLAGLMGGLLAQVPDDPLLAACRAVVWHGSAADRLARRRGQVSVEVTEILDDLALVLRD